MSVMATLDAPPEVFPLPPGMSMAQFTALQHSIVVLVITHTTCFSILIWDYFSLLPDEISLYRASSRKLWRHPPVYAFIILRYASILATLPSLFFTTVPTRHCKAAVIVSALGACLVTASSGMIFACRVFAMWSGHRFVYGVVGFLYIIMVGCWIAFFSRVHAENGPIPLIGSNCQPDPVPRWSPGSFASSMAFDSAILTLTLIKLKENRASRCSIGFLIYRDSLLYFSIATIANFTVLLIHTFGSNNTFIKPTSIPFSTLCTATMGNRTFLNLMLFKQRQQRRERFPMNSSSHDRSIRTPSTSRGGESSQALTLTIPTKMYEATWDSYRSYGTYGQKSDQTLEFSHPRSGSDWGD